MTADTDLWSRRRARAVELMGRTPHAEEILAFYVGLLEIQSGVAKAEAVKRGVVSITDGASALGEAPGAPRLHPDRLQLDELLPAFSDFLERAATIGTDVIADACAALLAGSDRDRLLALREGLEPDSSHSPEGGFHGRAFLEPVLTTLASLGREGEAMRATGGREHGEPVGRVPGDSSRYCPVCGGLPAVAALRDLPDALGCRTLVCSMCATEWRFPRLTCPSCGEADATKLAVHAADSVAHVRLDECRSCGHYVKTVDLRADGGAVAIVDELATVELDLWARDRGLQKIRLNLLGL